jgi:arabinan endo-1,5-alpha-L-arabinosidase
VDGKLVCNREPFEFNLTGKLGVRTLSAQKQKLSDIHLRDPYILADRNFKKYYLYGSIGQNVWKGKAIGFDVYVSDDLEDWSGPIEAFRPSSDFWSDRHYWAPEVYERSGKYYMFASFKSEQRSRGTALLTADSPIGPFQPIGMPLTPSNWECLDGTLYEDEAGTPWMIFCREWIEVKDGEMYAMRLQPDLRGAESEPILLFKASQAPWSVGFQEAKDHYITDGPFLHRLAGGELVMLWSTGGAKGYTMGLARSRSGSVTGPWEQDPDPVFTQDGGHGMLFTGFDGTSYLTLHIPNEQPNERPVIYPVSWEEGNLLIDKGHVL